MFNKKALPTTLSLLFFVLIVLTLLLLTRCGGQQPSNADPPSTPVSTKSTVPLSNPVAIAQETSMLTWYDTTPHILSGVNPIGSQAVATIHPGSVVRVFGAVWQAGLVDNALQVQVLMQCSPNLVPGCQPYKIYGPVLLQQTTSFGADMIFYPTPKGVFYRVDGQGQSSTWIIDTLGQYVPSPYGSTLGGSVDGEGPIDLSLPTMFFIQVLGNVKNTSQTQVVSNDLTVKVY